MDVGWRIHRAAKSGLGLNPIWTVAANKLVAKVASRVVKPVGEYWVEAGNEEEFLKPLPVHLLPGLEPGDLLRLREFRLGLMGDVLRWTLCQLAAIFGAQARQIFESVRGIDPSPVLAAGQQAPKVAEDFEFAEDTNDEPMVHSALCRLAEQAGLSLRRQRLVAQRLGVALDYSDGFRAVRQASLARPTANDFFLFDQARVVLDQAWTRRVRLRHVRLICDRLTFPPAQLELFAVDDPVARKRDGLVAAMDKIRSRFGRDAVCLGRSRLAGAS
jgi:DNA polymerase-4